jgi:hypothetical protein
MTRLIIVTALLAVVAVVVFWRGRTANPQRTVKVTARAGLARGSSVAVIEVDGRRFLIGAAGNAVNVLAELATATVEVPADASVIAVESLPPPQVAAAPALPAPAGSFAGPLERLKSMTVRTPQPARRALRSEL